MVTTPPPSSATSGAPVDGTSGGTPAGSATLVPRPGGEPIEVGSGGSAFVQAAGLRLTSVAAGEALGSIELGPEHHQPWGIVHGGVYTTAIETAATVGGAVYAAQMGLLAVGVNNNTNFVRALSDGPVDVTARPLQQGRTQQLWEVRVVDRSGRLIATGQVRLANIAPPNTVS